MNAMKEEKIIKFSEVLILFLNIIFYFTKLPFEIRGIYLLIAVILLNFLFINFFRITSKNSFINYLIFNLTTINLLFDELYLFSFKSNQLMFYINVFAFSTIIGLTYQNFIILKNNKFNVLFLLLFYEFSSQYLISRTPLETNIEYILFLVFLLCKKYVPKNYESFYIYSLILMLTVDNLLIFYVLIFYIFKEYLNFSFNNFYLSIFYFLYLILNFNSLYEHLKINLDNYVWFFSGIRGNLLSSPSLLSTFDNKGFLIGLFYKYLIKFITLFNLDPWTAIVFGIYLFLLIFIVYLFKFSKKIDLNSSAVLLSVFFVTNELILNNDTNIRLDARLLGSLFIFIGIYYLLDEKYYISSLLLTLSVYFLITFLIPNFGIFIYLLFKNKINNKFIFGILITNLVIFLYLFISGQLYYQYIFQLKYIFSHTPFPTNFGITSILLITFNVIFLISLSFNLNYFIKHQFILKLIFVWNIFEILHIYLTDGRFNHYKNLLVIPTCFFLSILLSNVENFNYFYKSKNLIAFSLIFILFFSNQFSEFKYVNANNLSQYQKFNINISMHQHVDFKRYIKSPQFEFGLFLSANTEDFYYYYDNFNIVPSGKTWPLVAFETNTEGFFEEDELNTIIIKDFNSEMPKYLILDLENISSYDSNLLQMLNLDYFEIICTNNSCLYEIIYEN